jgi:hypothetical protein
MNNKLLFDRVKESTKQMIVIQSTELYNPDTWLKDGTSPTEIILATAILVESIAGLLNVLTASKRR